MAYKTGINNITARINSISRNAQKSRETLRSKYFEWWKKFTTPELERLAKGDPAMIENAERMGFQEIGVLAEQVLTPEEKAELHKIEEEIIKNGNYK